MVFVCLRRKWQRSDCSACKRAFSITGALFPKNGSRKARRPGCAAAKISIPKGNWQRRFPPISNRRCMTGLILSEDRSRGICAQKSILIRQPVIDLAIKYGYDSAAAFSRAFARQHSIAPSVYGKYGCSLINDPKYAKNQSQKNTIDFFAYFCI